MRRPVHGSDEVSKGKDDMPTPTTAATATAATAAVLSDTPPDVLVAVHHTRARLSHFFSFANEGKVTWWSVAVLCALAAATVAAVVVLALSSSSSLSSASLRRRLRGDTAAALRALGAAYCPWLSPVLSPLAFTAWRASCASVHTGQLAACHTSVDCLLHGPTCASPAVLARLQCVHAAAAEADGHDTSTTQLPLPRVGHGSGVCALVASPQLLRGDEGDDESIRTRGSEHADVVTASVIDAFCTAPHTRCALCVGDVCSARQAVLQCVHEDECSRGDDHVTSHSPQQWWCA